MGNVNVKPEQSEIAKAHDFLNKKEYELISLEAEVDRTTSSRDYDQLLHLKKELNSLVITLRVLKQENNWTRELVERCDRLSYNYEIILAKVVSVLNETRRERRSRRKKLRAQTPDEPQAQFFVSNEEEKKTESVEDEGKPGRNLIDFTEDEGEGEEEEEDGVMYSNLFEIQKRSRSDSGGLVHKPPVPIPRNLEEAKVRELPKSFEKLQRILKKAEKLDEEDLKEVYEIKSRFYEVQEIYLEKIKEALIKFEEQGI